LKTRESLPGNAGICLLAPFGPAGDRKRAHESGGMEGFAFGIRVSVLGLRVKGVRFEAEG